jgi:hypothetical protein
MKWAFFVLAAVAFTGIFAILQYNTVTGKSAVDTATLTIHFGDITDAPPVVTPPSQGGGSGGSGSNSQNSVAPAVRGSASGRASAVTTDDVVKNYYESQPLKFAPITTSVATIKSPAERGRLTTRTMTFAIGLALIVIAVLIVLLLSHSHKPKKHRFKRNKV